MDESGNKKQRNFVNGLIIVGLIIIVFFGLRTVRAFREFHGHRPPPPFDPRPAETDVTLIRDWMTIPFISKMYHVQPHLLFEALAIPERENKEKSLKQLNDEYYPETEGVVLDKVKATVQTALTNQPQPVQVGPGPSATP